MIRSRERRNRRARRGTQLVRREIIATNRFERSFARSHGKPHASSFARELAAQRQDRPEVTVQ